MNFGRTFLKGKFTYAISALTVVWAIYGLVMGLVDVETASTLISGSLIAFGVRRNMSEVK